MSSANKQQKRAKRAKTKAKQSRVARQNPHTATPIVPDYFMPDFLSPDVALDEDDLLLEAYVEPELLETLNDEEREAMKALLTGDMTGLPTEDEMQLNEVYERPAPEPSEEQRIAHFEALKQAELEGEHALLSAFARGPVAAHALYNSDFNHYDDILVNSLGAYWRWAHGLDEEAVRARIVNDDFYEAFRDVLGEIEEEMIDRLISGQK